MGKELGDEKIKNEKKGMILPVRKPVGFSSYDLIRAFKKQAGFQGKVGHAGALDPFATGLVLFLLGEACKRFDEIKTWDKVYLAGIRLGAFSQTGDVEGEIKIEPKAEQPSFAEIKKTLEKFKGEIIQKVPLYSAAKYKGQPFYKIARKDRRESGRSSTPAVSELAGTEKKKKVNIKSLNLVAYKWPLLTVRAAVSGGVYIRQLAMDIGEQLKTSAFLYFLEREKIGEFSLEKALLVDDFAFFKNLA